MGIANRETENCRAVPAACPSPNSDYLVGYSALVLNFVLQTVKSFNSSFHRLGSIYGSHYRGDRGAGFVREKENSSYAPGKVGVNMLMMVRLSLFFFFVRILKKFVN